MQGNVTYADSDAVYRPKHPGIWTLKLQRLLICQLDYATGNRTVWLHIRLRGCAD